MSTKYEPKRAPRGKFLTAALAAALMLSLPLGAFAGNSPTLVRTTAWGFPEEFCLRGLAYDGHYYYIAGCGGAGFFTGRIYIYDENGFVKQLPEDPPVDGVGFAHGVATDGVRLWTTDYFGGHIYEYEIASGHLSRSIDSPVSTPVRLEFDSSTQTLWVNGAEDPNVYQVDLNGRIVSSFSAGGYARSKSTPLDGMGGLWVDNAEGGSPSLLRRYTFAGELVEEIPAFTTGHWAMATNIHDRSAGFIVDAEAAYNPATGRNEHKIQHYAVAGPFAAFSPRAELKFGPKANDDSYWVRGWLKLAESSNGIDPLTEAVTIKVGPFSHTLPAGSFVQEGAAYSFKGPVGPSALDVRITPSSNPGRYSFKSCLKNGDLNGMVMPPKASLTVGDDSGEATLDVGYAKFGKGADGQKWVFPPAK